MNLFPRRELVTPEGWRNTSLNKQEQHNETLTPFAFNRSVARDIKERNDWACEVTGRKASRGWRLDASHVDHDRNNPYYNNPRNGECLCLTEHMKFHIGILYDAIASEDAYYIKWAKDSLKLLSKRAYQGGLRTDDYYLGHPLDIIDDRDEVVNTLVEEGLTPEEYILWQSLEED